MSKGKLPNHCLHGKTFTTHKGRLGILNGNKLKTIAGLVKPILKMKFMPLLYLL